MKSNRWILLVFLLALPITYSAPQFDIISPLNTSYIINPIPVEYNVTGESEGYLCIHQLDIDNDGLVGWWRMDEANGTSIEDSALDNDGTFTGESSEELSYATPINAVWTSSGKYGGAYSFDGDGDYIVLYEQTNIPYNATPHTLSAWINIDSLDNLGVGDNLVIVSWGNGATKEMRSFEISSGGNLITSYYGYDFDTGYTPSIGEWVYVSWVFNGTYQWIYADGSLVDEDAVTGINTIQSGNVMRFGQGTYGFDNYFNGTIDEVRIYNYTLSQSEIQSDMDSPYPIKRPVFSYSFETNSNSRTYDTHIFTKGNYSSSVSFDGADDYISISESSDLNISNEITVGAWVKTNKDGHDVIYDDGASTGTGVTLYYHSGNYFAFLVENITGNYVLSIYNNPTSDTWYYVVGVYNGTHTILYINGNEVDSDRQYGDIRQYSYGSAIGSETDGANYFNGTIDEVRVYNHSLSSSEVLKLYQSYSQYNTINNTLYSTTESITSGTHDFYLECRDNKTIYPTVNVSETTFTESTFGVDVYDEDTLVNITFDILLTNTTFSTNQSNVQYYQENWDNLPMNDVDIFVDAVGYTQRKFTTIISPDSIYNITAYLLQTSSGNLVRFHIKNQADTPLTDVDVNAYKYINFNWEIVEETESDDAGVGTLFLNPLSAYTIEFSKSGYFSANYTIQPSTQDYTIILTEESAYMPSTEELTNITYSIEPQMDVNNTNVYFEFTINSFDSKLEWFAFNITYNVTDQLYFSNQTTSSGGTISTTQDLSGYNTNFTIVTHAIFKKEGVDDPTYINNSYYIWEEKPPGGLTDMLSTSEWLKTELDLENSNSINKFVFGFGVIIVAILVGAMIPGNGSGYVVLGIIGIGMFLGYLNFFATGSPYNIGILFGVLCLTYVGYVFLRGGV